MFLLNTLVPTMCYNVCVGSTGLLFSYTMGALSYLKNKNVDYHLIGTSGGSWCSLIYHLENDISNHDLLWDNYVGDRDTKINLFNNNDMKLLQESMVNGIKSRHGDKDVSELPLSIVTTKMVYNVYPQNVIINEFDDIDDVINYALCSSYIPYICGKSRHIRHKNQNFIDGYIFRNEKLISHCDLHIDKTTWGRKYGASDGFVLDYHISKKIFYDGRIDAMKNLTNSNIIKKLSE